MNLAISICVGCLLVLHVSVAAQQQASYNCSYSTPLRLASGDNDDAHTVAVAAEDTSIVYLEHYVNRYEQTITLKMTYTEGWSWLGLGWNLHNQTGMFPALAVIGDRDRQIQRYALTSSDKKGTGVVPLLDTHRHLKNGFLTQNEENEEDYGTTVLVFSHDLIMYQEGSNDTNTSYQADMLTTYEITTASIWIWAVGMKNNQWDGKHKLYGSFQLPDLHDGCEDISGGGDIPDEATPTPTVNKTTLPPNNTIPPKTVPQNSTPSPASSSGGRIPVETDSMGDPLPNHDHSTTNGNSVFDQFTDAEWHDPTIEVKVGVETSSFYASTRWYWSVHAILMSLAWGVLAPLVVGTALWRYTMAHRFHHKILLGDQSNLWWSRVHHCLSLAVAVLTLLGYSMAILATRQGTQELELSENKAGMESSSSPYPLFASLESTHALFGMVILVFMLVHALAEYFHRCLPGSSSVEAESEQEKQQQMVDGPKRRMMLIDGLPITVPQEVSSPPISSSVGLKERTRSDSVSVLTTSVYDEQMAIRNNLNSALGGRGDDSAYDTDRDLGDEHFYTDNHNNKNSNDSNRHPDDQQSLPNVSLEDDKFVFADDDEDNIQMWGGVSVAQLSKAASAAMVADTTTPRTSRNQDITLITSPNTSREEEATPRIGRNMNCCGGDTMTGQCLRSCWGVSLIGLAVIILGLAWYNCHTGIVLQTQLADLEDFQSILLAIYWGFAVGTLLLVLVTYVVAVRTSKTDGNEWNV